MLLVHKGFSTLGDSGGVLTMLDSGIAVISHDVWFNGYRWGSAALYPVSMVSGISFTSPDSSGPCCAAASSCLPWGRGAGPWMPGFLAGVQEGRCSPLTWRHSRHFEVFMRGSDGYGSLGE